MTTPKVNGVRRLAQADALLLLAEFISRSPDPADPATAVAEVDVRRLASVCGLDPGSETARALVGLPADRGLTPAPVWEAERSRLFEGAAICPPNETAYIRRDKGAILADLAGFFRAFGFVHEDEVGEKQDHVVSELQFAAMLQVMLARAEAEEHAERVEVTRNALRSFAEDHLGAWIGMFCERLVAASALSAFTQIGVALQGIWRQVCVDNDLPDIETAGCGLIGPTVESPYECDGCPPV